MSAPSPKARSATAPAGLHHQREPELGSGLADVVAVHHQARQHRHAGLGRKLPRVVLRPHGLDDPRLRPDPQQTYEVARLHLDPAFRPYVSSQVGAFRRLRWHLHPPLLRELGLKRKLRLGPGVGVPAYRVLRSMRRLHGTPFDPFGRTSMRRLERELITEYVDALTAALPELTAATYPAAVELAELPQLIRGYEQVKLDAVERYRARLAELRLQLPVAL